MNCIHYKEKGSLVGFCKKFVKIVKASLVRECFEEKEEPTDPINPINTNETIDTKITNYKKIIIRDGKKIYI